MATRLGVPAWQGLYSLVAIVGVVLVVKGYGEARYDTATVYLAPRWLHMPAVVLQALVFPLLLATYLPGRIKTAVGHPMLTATMLWAVAHLMVSGALVNVILFGAILVWAAADRASIGNRTERPLPGLAPFKWNDAVAVVLGLGIYAALLLGGHRWLFGVSPLG